VETTTKNKGHPFTPSNKLCSVGLAADKDSPIVLKIEYDLEPYGENLHTIQKFVDLSDLLVGFNLKFDLHWLRRYGINFSGKRVWDCQLAEFIIRHQLEPYPSLDGTLLRYGLGQKVDVVQTEYWDKGIDTPDVPWDVLYHYNEEDINLTRKLYEAQQEYLADKPKLKKLINLVCFDLLVLQEMEWNGLQYDVEESLALAGVMEDRAKVVVDLLAGAVGVSGINWNSPEQVSAVLYGGQIRFTSKQLVPFTYKDGRTVQKLKNVETVKDFPRLVDPLPKTELKKQNTYQTGADVLTELKAKGKVKEIIKLLLEISDIDKQVSTYLKGIPKLIAKQEWADNTIHGQLNQCVAVTGRLSSSNPNMQNMTSDVDKLFRSRYAD
jgi:DNA polymerase I